MRILLQALWRVAPAERRPHGGHLARCFGTANMPARCRRYAIYPAQAICESAASKQSAATSGCAPVPEN
ncbi:MAG: hypothetical protein DMG82_14475 [Acidobacteria bacterium]|nr:MAG: hypothetical protein DMG82_14475 [Acidobacteriota bacterium]